MYNIEIHTFDDITNHESLLIVELRQNAEKRKTKEMR